MGNPITIQTLSGAAPTWDALYKFAKITAEANTAITISGAGTPDGGVLHFIQDATGSRTLTINGTSVTVNTAAGSLTRIDWAFDGTYYSYHTNVQGGTSGEATITPDAPTGGTVDDDANTFTFTLNPSYAASEHEYSINGASYVACSSNVISVGNVAVAIGDLKVRVKAGTNRNASADLTNAAAFTVGSSYTPTYAPAYVSALTAAGETVPAGHQTAFNSFEEALYNAGILTKFKQLLLYYGSGINGVQKDFMGLQDCAIMGSPTFSGGVVLNGSSQYVNSNLVPSTSLGLNNFSFHQKLKNNTAPSNGATGAYTGTSGEVSMIQFGYSYDGSNSTFVFGSDGSVLSIANPAAWNSLWSLTRRSATDAEGYIAGASVGTNTTTPAVGLPTNSLYYGARHSNSVTENYLNNTLEFGAIADSMTDAEVSALNTAIVNLWSAIGR